jgi:hypothetical protein
LLRDFHSVRIGCMQIDDPLRWDHVIKSIARANLLSERRVNDNAAANGTARITISGRWLQRSHSSPSSVAAVTCRQLRPTRASPVPISCTPE